jgi:hypothetical protein
MPPPLTRGPLPASVYWRRRLVLLGLVTVLVVALARLLGGSSDGSSADDAVTPAAGQPTTTGPSESPTATRRTSPRATPTQPTTSAAPVLAEPEGRCADADVKVTPSAVDAIAGRDVVLLLDLRTVVAEACTWRVSPSSLTLRIRSGKDAIWSSAQCPRVVPVKDLVVRRDVGTTVPVVWNSRRSDEECTRLTKWALPGFYFVAGAALGGEPAEVQFQLAKPVPDVVVSSAPAAPRTSATPNGGGTGGGKPNKPDDDAPPSGAVEPDGR